MTGTLKTNSEVYAIFLQECQMDLFKYITKVQPLLIKEICELLS